MWGIFPRASFTRGEQGSSLDGPTARHVLIRSSVATRRRGLLTGDAIDFPGPQIQAPHPSRRSVTAFIFKSSGTAVELATPHRKLIQSRWVRELAITYLTHLPIPPIGLARSILGLQLRGAHYNIAEALARQSLFPHLQHQHNPNNRKYASDRSRGRQAQHPGGLLGGRARQGIRCDRISARASRGDEDHPEICRELGATFPPSAWTSG